MNKAVVSEDVPSMDKREGSWAFLGFYSSYLGVILDVIKNIFNKDKILTWNDLRARAFCKVNYHFTKLWMDKKSEKAIGDLFTYSSFASLVLTCCGTALGINITAITIIKTVGAVSTIGSVALKVSSKLSAVNLQLFQLPKRLDNIKTLCALTD